jgi:hypothetical protein
MAKIKVGVIRQLHEHLGQILAEYDASKVLAEGAQDNPPEFTGKPKAPGMDSARAHRALVPGYDRLRDGTGGRGEMPDHGLRPSGRTIGRDGNEIS